MQYKHLRFEKRFRLAFRVGSVQAAEMVIAPQPLKPGCLLVVERGERHEIRNTGRTSLMTLNLNPPAADAPEDEELLAGES